MLGPRQEFQAALFYEFNLEDHVPDDHLLRLCYPKMGMICWVTVFIYEQENSG